MQLKATVEVAVPEDLGLFQEVEGKIREAMFEVGRELLSQVFDFYEEWYLRGKRGVWKKDQREKWFQTCVGEVRRSRWRVWDPKSGGHRYPLDEWLGLEGRDKVTSGLKQVLVEAAVQRPYRQANREVERLTGIKRSVMSLWKMVQEASQKQRDQEEATPDWHMKPIPRLDPRIGLDPCPILSMDPDATYCRNQDKEAEDHEIKMAVLYTGKAPVNRNKTQWKLLNKQVLFSRSGESVESFFNRTSQKAMSHYGAHFGTQVIIHGDGDPWIKRLKSGYWDQALIRLDPWHVFKRIREATGLKQIRRTWVKAVYKNPDRLIWMLQVWKVRKTSSRSEARQKMEELIQYLKNNREGLLPSGIPKEIKEKYTRMFLRGSGTIESNICLGIADRFKQRRMSWSAKGKDNLLYLREKFLNGEPTKMYHVPQPITRKVA